MARVRLDRRRGFVLITTALCAVVLMGAAGLAVDLGRMYAVKSETQSYVDSAALNGAMHLDGTPAGLDEALAKSLATRGTYDFSSRNFAQPQVKFGVSEAGPWEPRSSAPLNSRFVQVTATAQVGLYIMRAVTPAAASDVSARAVAGQVEKTVFREGLFPFSPFAKNDVGPRFGLTPGTEYTLRWPTNVNIDKKNQNNLCGGDRDEDTIAKAQAMGGEERGYIEDGSSSIIREAIVNDYMSIRLEVGSFVNFRGGEPQTQLDSLHERIAQDTDDLSQTYAQYVSRNTGNGRRLIACPINGGDASSGINRRVLGYGAFFLRRTANYGAGGDQAWCAEYVGAWVEGSRRKGVQQGGTYVVRLVA